MMRITSRSKIIALCVASTCMIGTAQADAKPSMDKRIKNQGHRIDVLEETNQVLIEAVTDLLNENDRLTAELDQLYYCLRPGYQLFSNGWMVIIPDAECFND